MEQVVAFFYFAFLGVLTAAILGGSCWLVAWAAYKMEQWWEK